MGRKVIDLPMSGQDRLTLKAGDLLLLNGWVYTARDAAHMRMEETLLAGKQLPFPLVNQTLYYAGPCPAKPGQVIGSAGPTTSGRMDSYTPLLLEHGLRVMIGKGKRAAPVNAAIKQHGAVYLGATGGAGALIARCVVSCEIIAYPELGPEAVRRLEIKNFPVIVLCDSNGDDWYQIGRQNWIDSHMF